MPVLSPHRSTASSGLTGTYRSGGGYGSSLEGGRSGGYGGYGGGSTSYISPRITSYASERYSTRSYADSSGRSYYSRAASITEDSGYTSRYSSAREETTREPSVRRESRLDNILDSPVRRSLSTTSDLSTPTSRSSSISVADSIADLRNKYSVSSYVPAVIRNRDTSRTRSSTASDLGTLGLPPSASLKVTTAAAEPELNRNSVSANTNHTTNIPITIIDIRPDVDNMRPRDSSDNDDDDNGNRRGNGVDSPPPGGVSVLEMTRKFERRCVASSTGGSSSSTATASGAAAATQTRAVGRRLAGGGGGAKQESAAAALTVTALSVKKTTRSTSNAVTSPTKASSKASSVTQNGRHHVNDFASYIPIENPDEAKSKNGCLNGVKTQENGDCGKVKKPTKDVNCTSPRLTRSPIATSNGGGALGGSSSGRNSLERDGAHPRGAGGASCDSTSGSSTTTTSSATPTIYDRASPVKQMGLNGLKNIGNTCFMNSVVQCLSNTRPLLEYVKKDGYAADINTTLSSMKGALIKAFAQVMKELWSEDCSDRVVNTVALKSQIQRFAPRFMGYSQQDAQEFLRYLLEGLHEDVNRVTSKPTPIHTEIDDKLSDTEKATESWQRYLRRDNSKIVDLFVGQFKSTLKCTHCGHCSVTFDPFWDLSLPIPQKTGAVRLSQCLDSFTREETLDGDEKPTCSKCKERRKCTKSFTIHKFPKILVIHLKRFSPTERFRGKLSVTVDFPFEGLDMSGYASESSNLQCRYNLYAVSNHSGTTYSGHYTAYCRHPYSGSWHEYNDSRVSSISSKSVVSGEAYVLFYEQDGKVSAHL